VRETTILLLFVGVIGCNRSQKPPENALTAEGTMTAQDWFARGNHLRDTDKEDAIEAYTDAIRLDPFLEEAYFNRALTNSELGRDQEAVHDKNLLTTRRSELGKKLQGLFGAVRDANISMGAAAVDAGDWNLALDKYNIALTYDPNSSDAHVGRGFIFSQKGKYDDAIAEFDRALKSNPNAGLAYYNGGQTNLARSQFKLAVADFTKAIELEPNEPSAYRERARAFENLGELAMAKADIEAASLLEAMRMGGDGE
jgi:Tfp pilus assembly protein PilF